MRVRYEDTMNKLTETEVSIRTLTLWKDGLVAALLFMCVVTVWYSQPYFYVIRIRVNHETQLLNIQSRLQRHWDK